MPAKLFWWTKILSSNPVLLLICFSPHRTRKQTKPVTNSHLNGFRIFWSSFVRELRKRTGTTTLIKTLSPLTQQLVKMKHFPPPSSSTPGAVLTLCIQICFNTINTAWGGGGTVEIGSHNNIPKVFQEVEYKLILQSAS